MTSLESIQSKLLSRHGYNKIAPFWGKYEILSGKWCYQKEGIFHVIDGYLSEDKRGRSLPVGNVLLRLSEDGYHICIPSQKDKSSYYPIKDDKYIFVWEDNGYNELSYLRDNNIDDSLSFEFVETDFYLALLFHKQNKENGVISIFEDGEENDVRLDCIVSKQKDILLEDVFTYFHNDIIVVYDGERTVIYNSNFDIMYERDAYLRIWEVAEKIYLLFPNDKVVYELCEGKEISLDVQTDRYWGYSWAYKDYIIFYEQNYYRVERRSSYYDDDDWGYDDEPIDVPVRNTIGHVFDSSFKLLRDFNVLGEIVEVKEVGDEIVMKTHSVSSDQNDSESYYNIKVPNQTRRNPKTGEEFTIPDISFKRMDVADYTHYYYIVRTRVVSSDLIDFEKGTRKDYCKEKCGVYYKNHYDKEEYEKIIDCKYDSIVSWALDKDENIYYVGFIGKGADKKYDLYINHQIKLKNLPYKKEASSLKVVNNSRFVRYKDVNGKVGIIRNGDILLKPLYEEVTIFVKRDYLYDEDNKLEFLFVVSDGESYGICSPTGNLVLPVEYSLIDIDEELTIILEHKDCDSMEVGFYDEENDSISHNKAEMEDGVIHLDDDYIWDGCFRYLNENEHTGWTDQELRDAADIAYEGYSRLYLGLED